MSPQPYTATLDDGTQILVDVWPDNTITVATRERTGDGWGPPVEAVRADVERAA